MRRPRDKAKAEACPRMGESGVAVQLVERWTLAALRHRTFFSLTELNRAIAALLARLNERPFHKLPGSRRSAFESIGPATPRYKHSGAGAALITHILHPRRHPEHSYRACLGILRLAKTYSNPRLEAAAQRALTLGTRSVRSIESIPRFRRSGAGLKHRLDQQAPNDSLELPLPADHDNVRGPAYFH